MRIMIKAMAIVLTAIGVGAAANAQERSVNVISFPGGFNLPIWVAQEKGFFANHGLKVELTPTRDSVYQMGNLIAGKYDIAMTAFDNVLAYRDGTGESDLVKGEAEVQAFMGADRGFLNLVAVPEVKAVPELRGKTVGVDALTTGYAFVLRAMLAEAGLGENDYKTVRAGGVSQRFEKLLAKEFEATLLVSPLEIAAKAKGFNVLGQASSLLGDYQGVVAAASNTWIKDNTEAAKAYVAGYIQAVDWLYAPDNRQEAIQILRSRINTMSQEQAEAALNVLVDAEKGIQPKAKLEPAAAAKVLQLRAQYSAQPPKSDDISRYYRDDIYTAAVSE